MVSGPEQTQSFNLAGPGFLVAVGYMDPGNWATDLAGGAKFGYALLSVVMTSKLDGHLAPALVHQTRRRHGTRSGTSARSQAAMATSHRTQRSQTVGYTLPPAGPQGISTNLI